METLKLLLVAVFICFASFSSPVSLFAGPGDDEDDEIDCGQMVEECKDNNPYHWLISWSEYHAFNLGCETAGGICEQLQSDDSD